jgi:hypothetical protein
MGVRPPGVLLVALTLGLAASGACGAGTPADAVPVLLSEGRSGQQAWRLEGRRTRGAPCVSLTLDGSPGPAVDWCGIRRTDLRHIEPAVAPVGDRLLVFSSLPARARRVRFDGSDGSIRIEPARTAPGFPARFFVIDVDPAQPPAAVRAFAEGGRAVVT